MPNSTNGVRNRVTKRSEQRRDQDLESPTRPDISRRENEEPDVVLGHSSTSLQRLASVARFFESYTRDIQVVEHAYEVEMERENKIRTLHETVQTLTHSKSEEVEKLRQENQKLLAEQAACQKVEKESREIIEKLEIQSAKADAERQEKSKQKLQEKMVELDKAFKIEKAKIEKEAKQKAEESKKTKAKLSEKNVELENRCSEAEKKLEMKKKGHKLALRGLENMNEKLTQDLEDIKSDFPIEGKSIEY